MIQHNIFPQSMGNLTEWFDEKVGGRRWMGGGWGLFGE